MQVGRTRVTIRPAMAIIIGGILVGVVGFVGARLYASGPIKTEGGINPKRWVFGSDSSAQVTLKMLSSERQNALSTTKDGYSDLNAEEGFQVIVREAGTKPNSIYIRNAIDLEKADIGKNMEFRFVGSAPKPFPITFTIRDTEIKSGGKLLWSHTFTVNGDFKNYSQEVPSSALANRKSKFMIIAGHLGATPGTVTLRQITLK